MFLNPLFKHRYQADLEASSPESSLIRVDAGQSIKKQFPVPLPTHLPPHYTKHFMALLENKTFPYLLQKSWLSHYPAVKGDFFLPAQLKYTGFPSAFLQQIFFLLCEQNIWATSWENLAYAICDQQRRRSACSWGSWFPTGAGWGIAGKIARCLLGIVPAVPGECRGLFFRRK